MNTLKTYRLVENRKLLKDYLMRIDMNLLHIIAYKSLDTMVDVYKQVPSTGCVDVTGRLVGLALVEGWQ